MTWRMQKADARGRAEAGNVQELGRPVTKWTYAIAPNFNTYLAIGSDGTIYMNWTVDGVNYLYAFNPSGAVKWSSVIRNSTAAYGSPRVRTVGGQDIIYVAYSKDMGGHNRGAIRAIDNAGGLIGDIEIVNSASSTADTSIHEDSIAIDENGNIYCSGHERISSGNNHFLYKYSAAGVRLLHHYIYRSTTGFFRAGAFVIYEGMAFTNFRNQVYKIDGSNVYDYTYSTSKFTNPISISDNVIYTPINDTSLLALNLDLTTKWEVPYGNTPSQVAIGMDGVIYFCVYNNNLVYSLYPNGTEKWNAIFTGPREMMLSGNDIVHAVANSIRAFSPVDGSTIWTLSSPRTVVPRSLVMAKDGSFYNIVQDSSGKRLHAWKGCGLTKAIPYLANTKGTNPKAGQIIPHRAKIT